MKNFLLDKEKDFERFSAKVPRSDTKLELLCTAKDEYTVFLHDGGNVYEMGVYNKQELKTLWLMLSCK
jgi:hypothetical protein